MSSLLAKRLQEIRKSIKAEAIDIFDNEDTPRNENIQRLQQDPPQSNNEALREQFLNKNLTSQEVIGALSGRVDTRIVKHEGTQVAGVYNRAEDINARLRGNLSNSSFYATIPENINEATIPSSRHESPLVLNNNNAMFNIQASTENVTNVMMNSNPYRDIPYNTQATAKTIGANLEAIRKAISDDSQKRKIPPPPPFSEAKKSQNDTNIKASTSTEDRPIERVEHKEMVDKCVETTVNTGTLRFEITSSELEDLSEDKKLILLEFMKAFNIRDNREIKSIRERLKHRLANQENKRKQYQSSYGSYQPTYGPPI